MTKKSPQASEQVTFSWDVDWGLDSREQIFPRKNHFARETTEDHTSWSMCEEDESGITLPWPDSDQTFSGLSKLKAGLSMTNITTLW